MALKFLRFLDHTQRRATVGGITLDEWSARRRDLYLTTHNRTTSMTPAVFEPTILARERPQTCALDRAATGNNKQLNNVEYFNYLGSMKTNDANCTREIRCRIVMAKAAFNENKTLFISRLDWNLRKNRKKVMHLEHRLLWCRNLGTTGSRSDLSGKYWNAGEGRTVCVRNEEVLHIVKGENAM